MSKAVVFYRSARKAVVGGVGVVAQVVASGVLAGTALHWAQAVLAVATVLGVYKARNEAPVIKGTPPADPPVAPVAPVTRAATLKATGTSPTPQPTPVDDGH